MSLTPDAVAAKQHAESWQDAVRVVGNLHHKAGTATEEYTDAMIAAIEKFGPYVVLAPGVAVPHAATASGVIRGGLVVATLAEPVNFGSPANDPVDLLISFAAFDHDSHIERIKQLGKALADEALLAQLRAATTDDEILTALNSQD